MLKIEGLLSHSVDGCSSPNLTSGDLHPNAQLFRQRRDNSVCRVSRPFTVPVDAAKGEPEAHLTSAWASSMTHPTSYGFDDGV